MATTEITTVMPVENDELISFDGDGILALAERADKMVTALEKIMQAALKITKERDWCLIGGNPYLQESGATKVARLFGISWHVVDGYPVEKIDSAGYPEYHYRIEFIMRGARVECEGSRSSRDDFFAGAPVDRQGNPRKQKTPDEIDMGDVQRAAFTNCINNGIKRILPGLRNLDIKDLENAGFDTSKLKGYTFKEGSKGGAGKSAANSGLHCSDCKAGITQAEASYSEGRYNRMLCRSCQSKAKNSEPAETLPFNVG